MLKIKEVKIRFVDERPPVVLTGEDAGNAVAELFRYSREGKPRFIELGKDYYHAAAQISGFFIEEETNG